ncbi:hypothetical protein EX30DRAFT_264880 [Ascodesmis nigricans]|uniref:RanBP2-type domain-containing protein n=1 Tax=Ascodesmis nigricans TaxID=341454 RepID=A0A4S2MXS2_9PEZI|nr:hypothetical protein EX30DRAFT_264880 [Ascodesmis nigricans]
MTTMRITLRTPSFLLELLLLILCSTPISTSPLPLPLHNLSPRSPDDDDNASDDEDFDPNDRDGDGRPDNMETMPPHIVALIAACVLILVLAVVFGSLWFLRVRRRRLELAAGSVAKDNNNNVSRWSLRKSTTAATTAVNSAAPSVRGGAGGEKSRRGSREGGGGAGILSRRGSAGGSGGGGTAGKVEEDGEIEIDAEDVMSCSWCYIAKDGLCRWCREAREASESNTLTPNVAPISSESSSATVGGVVWNPEGKGKGKAPATKSVELSPLSAPLIPEMELVPSAALMPLMPLEPAALVGGRSGEVVMLEIGGDKEEVRRPVVKHSFAAGKGVYSIA